jgi:hypothetical protein
MIVSCKIQESVWSAAEAAEMSGVNPLLQRAWRTRNFLGQRRNARGLTSLEVAELRTLKTIRDRGVDLEKAASITSKAHDVLWFAVSHFPLTLIQPVGSREQEVAFRTAWNTAVSNAEGDWNFLKSALSMSDRNVVRFVAALESEQINVHDLGDIFDGEDEEAAVVLDLLVIGRRLGESASRPLLIAKDIRIEQGDAADDDRLCLETIGEGGST